MVDVSAENFANAVAAVDLALNGEVTPGEGTFGYILLAFDRSEGTHTAQMQVMGLTPTMSVDVLEQALDGLEAYLEIKN